MTMPDGCDVFCTCCCSDGITCLHFVTCLILSYSHDVLGACSVLHLNDTYSIVDIDTVLQELCCLHKGFGLVWQV